jgi:hypothetical protein|tara:strand:+ start:756 stop:1154 length:399 start_codon:yes stop_codon:yes gene_type:complete
LLLAEEAGDVDEVKQEIEKEAAKRAQEEAKDAKAEDSDDSDVIDNEEEGGEWVTAGNLYSHIGGANANNLMENQDNLLFTQIVDGQDRKENPEAEEAKIEAQPAEDEAPKTDVASPFAAPVVEQPKPEKSEA